MPDKNVIARNLDAEVSVVETKIDTLLARLTALRAVYLDELAAANIPADIDTLLTRLSALRAGYLDELDFDLDARLGTPAGASVSADLLTIDNLVDELETRLTAARAGYLDELAAANIPADIDTLLTRLSAVRAGYLDELDFDLDARLGTPAGASLAADLLTIDNLVDELETRLTATRAGYLDELAAANMPADLDEAELRSQEGLYQLKAGICLDATAGAAGTAYPIGTMLHPSSNFADALDIAGANNIEHLHCHGLMGNIADGAVTPFAGKHINGDVGPIGAPLITLVNTVDISNCNFEHCLLIGDANDKWGTYSNRCILIALTKILGVINDCIIATSIAPGDGILDIDNSTTVAGGITLNAANMGNAAKCKIHRFAGTMTITNLTTTGEISIYSAAGCVLTIANSCTGGTINIRGNVDVTDNSAGTTVNREDLAGRTQGLDDIYDEVAGLNGDAMRGTENAALATSLNRQQSCRDFWSAAAPVADTTISTTQATKAITPTVVVPSGAHGIPSGATIDCVHILAKWRQTEDSSGADNAIDNTANTMQIQIDDSGDTGWLTAYDFADDSYFVDGDVYSIGGGDMIEGITDIKTRVDGADTYDIQLLNAESDGDFLILRDLQWGLRIWWH